MEYIRITGIDDPNFDKMYQLMSDVFPAEEVLEKSLWADPLRDPSLRVCIAVHEGEVVGATEYRYLAELNVAMTDFTIVARGGLGVGRFLWLKRQADLAEMAARSGGAMIGMFAEVYDPGAEGVNAGTFPWMHPLVRREVLSHMGYQRLDFPYVHPSWQNNGSAVAKHDFCFLPTNVEMKTVPGRLVAEFLTTYYTVLPAKPKEWHEMVERLQMMDEVALRPL